MINSATADLLTELKDKQDKLAAAKRRLKAKKKTLMGTVIEDTPDLFGNRQSQSENKLFDIRVDPGQVSAALAPIKGEISALEREIEILTYKIVKAEDNTEPTLFDLGAD